MKNHHKNCNIYKLLEEFEKNHPKEKRPEGVLLKFNKSKLSIEAGDDLTIYNPTKPIKKGKDRFLLGRVEPLNSESSKVIFFVEDKNDWKVFDHPTLDLQDPFYIENIQGYQILGGVRTYPDPENVSKIGYETVFYKYKNCVTELMDPKGAEPKPFAVSPKRMKDIRLIELKNGKIAVFTRPQGREAGLGKIAYIEIDTLEELAFCIEKAKIIPGIFSDSDWGGANELHLLSNGTIGVLGHIAHFEGLLRHYYALGFLFNPATFKVKDLKILATADQFPSVKAKKSCLGKILFSGGMVRKNDGRADLYVGVGDTEAGCIDIADPFYGMENKMA